MITNDILRTMPARLREVAGGFSDEEDDDDSMGLLLEQAADVAEELLRLRQRLFKAGIHLTEGE